MTTTPPTTYNTTEEATTAAREMLNKRLRAPAVDCTGDAVAGDFIAFGEAVFTGSHRNPKFAGARAIVAEIIADSYGERRQQHTFTLRVIEARGIDAPDRGAKIRRKGRNVYRHGTARAVWDDESARDAAETEKHTRGDAARAARDARKEYQARFERLIRGEE